MRPHHAHWPVRVPHAIRVPATSLWDNLATAARRFPDKVAIEFLGNALRYDALVHQVERLAAHLHRLGVGRGDRVLLDMQNCPQLVVAHFAILRANAVVVPINPMNRSHELQHYITDSDARVALVTSDLAADMAQASTAREPSWIPQRLTDLVVVLRLQTGSGCGRRAHPITSPVLFATRTLVPSAWTL